MNNITTKIQLLWNDRGMRMRIIIVALALISFRLLAAVPIPGVDAARLAQFLDTNQFFGVLNVFSGGGLSKLSLILLGIGPYITGSIIMQLLTVMSPRLKALYQEEGEAGRRKFAQYGRLVTVPLAFIQGYGFLLLLTRQGVLGQMSLFALATNLIMIVAGSVLLMWIGEIATEFGIGNGTSLIIFAGIVAQLPREINQLLYSYDSTQLPAYLGFIVVAFIIIGLVVFVSEAERPISVTYAKQVRGSQVYGGTSTYIPIRLNQAGVMPIIFALSLLLFPQMIGNFMVASSHAWVAHLGTALAGFSQHTLLYGVCYFVLVFVFTYFYTSVTFDPHQMAENLQRGGAFIPGVRPGNETENFVTGIVNKTTFVGALFLGLIAILPLVMQSVTGISAIAIGGTALLIVVSVVIDLIKRMDAQVSLREY